MDEKALFGTFMRTAACCTELAKEDIPFCKSVDSKFGRSLSDLSKRLLNVSQSFLSKIDGNKASGLVDVEDINNRWSDIVDSIDTLLENADLSLDKAKGIVTKPKVAVAPVNNAQSSQPKKEKLPYRLIHAFNIPKPQLRFKHPVNNHPTTPWLWKLTEKPNALVPLEKLLDQVRADKALQLSLPHPYEAEIKNSSRPKQLYETKNPVQKGAVEETDPIWVDNSESLHSMLEELKQATEIAVDLEHHDYRSYSGFVCLMQISTRNQDWIVDTLELREELECLNIVFTDPKIIKVLHGATMDVIWLQRDFGLYLVGLFDTYYATKALGFEGHGLAFLLKKYCQFEADKRYQMADWRIRPLPKEMLKYAQSDTHFLLYVFDCLRVELLEQSSRRKEDLMQYVVKSSDDVALRRYEREAYDEIYGLGTDGWRHVLTKWGSSKIIGREALAVFKSLHRWRDQVARNEDESVRYVMPNHLLVKLAASMPSDPSDLYTSARQLPPLVRMYANEIIEVIQNAREDEVKRATTDEQRTEDTVMQDQLVTPVTTREVGAEIVIHTELFEPSTQNKAIIESMSTLNSPFWCASELLPSRKDKADRIKKSLFLSIPLPATALDTKTNEAQETQVSEPKQEPVGSVVPENEVLILHELGSSKRKRGQLEKKVRIQETTTDIVPEVLASVQQETPVKTESPDSPDEDSIAVARENVPKKRKQKKKKVKQAKTAAAEPETPFDYSAQKNPLLSMYSSTKPSSRSKASFNPYASTQDVKRDVKQVKKRKATSGKSKTY
ncbi:exosome subunit Rrp6 [Schizosaccharomyces japonicus yFS275]|uniref:Exosome subunit Rrp6 n=1 Tax=Schizosaccharomyces japonicus (strain yFS275 / FY16936) TaxID=402676 RepID=B6K2U5_SCHJY|nr:exosome subunit Rrp6 [Schizosaccharomyces japonicus yFS275]EEB08585.1 exosome subunit Rrp6 [Schizosaccharomyces japonicus yFS275]